jgi:hypothetical protein
MLILVSKFFERMGVGFIYTSEDSIMKPAKHCLKRKGGGRGMEINGGVSMFKLHYMHYENITIKSPGIINVC